MYDDSATPGLFEAIWRYRWMVAIIAVVFLVLSTVAGLATGTKASATSTVGLTTPSPTNVLTPGIQGDASLTRYSAQRAAFATSDDTLAVAAAQLPSTTVTDLQKHVTVTPSATGTTFDVTATASSADLAVKTVNAVVAAYGTQTQKQVDDLTAAAQKSLRASIATIQTELKNSTSAAEQQAAATTLSGLTTQAANYETEAAVFGDGVEFIQAATVDTAVTHRLPYVDMAIGLLLGLAVGVVIAWLLADRNRRLSKSLQAEAIFKAPLLGVVSDLQHPIRSESDFLQLTRSAREIVAPLLTRGAPPRVLLVTAAQRKVGATTTALTAAAAASAEGLRVIVIDGDPDTGGLAEALQLPRSGPGLLDAANGAELNTPELIEEVEIGSEFRFSAMTSGVADEHSTTLTAAGLRSLFERLRSRFDVIVIDAPSIGDDYIAAVTAGMADGVIVVVPNNAPVEPLAELQRSFVLSDAKVSGYVYTHVQLAAQATS